MSRLSSSKSLAFVSCRLKFGELVPIADIGKESTPKQPTRAFKRFCWADASGSIPGSGLSLSLVREIAELHKGKIMLFSNKSEGTTASLMISVACDPISVSSQLDWLNF
jgi:signal transduction histidine kinase